MTKVKSHIAKRGNKTVRVKEHTRKKTYHRNVKSSFIDRVSDDGQGGAIVTILGRDYPYPFIPKEKVGGLVRSGGSYYNKKIRGRYF